MFVFSLSPAFSGVYIEFDFVLITNAYRQYLKDSCKQYLALIGSTVIIKVCQVCAPIWNCGPPHWPPF